MKFNFSLYMMKGLHVEFWLQSLLGVFVFHFYYKLLNLPTFLHSAYRSVFSDFLAL